MHVGIDIGTTHIGASLFDGEREIRYTGPTFENRRIAGSVDGAFEQDPAAIERSVRLILESITGPVDSITVTGQVHGILYYDVNNMCVSPLATWLDQRSHIMIGGKSIQQLFADLTSFTLPTGYGFLTHFANLKLGLVPPDAVGFCGILEYITARLIGSPLSKSDPSCMGPMGCFDPVSKHYDPEIVEFIESRKMSFASESCRPFEIAGYTEDGIPVTYPVGDNQAGFFASVADISSSALVSIGTSGQLSLFSASSDISPRMELREFLGLGYLHVGATMTAGKAYERLKDLFKEVCEQISGTEVTDEAVFDTMRKTGAAANGGGIICHPLFSGTRDDDRLKASFENLTLKNFTMGNLVSSVVDGIVGELKEFLGQDVSAGRVEKIVATGSSVQKNPLFVESLERIFAMPVIISTIDDAAALGAALIGAVAIGKITLEDKNSFVDILINRKKEKI